MLKRHWKSKISWGKNVCFVCYFRPYPGHTFNIKSPTMPTSGSALRALQKMRKLTPPVLSDHDHGHLVGDVNLSDPRGGVLTLTDPRGGQ